MQPGCEEVGVADGGRSASKYKEDGLECVLGLMLIADKLPADAQNHWAVSRHERCERGFSGSVGAVDEPFEQLPVSEPGDGVAVEDRLDLPDDRALCGLGHQRVLAGDDLRSRGLRALIEAGWDSIVSRPVSNESSRRLRKNGSFDVMINLVPLASAGIGFCSSMFPERCAMPSPFPGMNPYFERSTIWLDFHTEFLTSLRRLLVPQAGAQVLRAA